MAANTLSITISFVHGTLLLTADGGIFPAELEPYCVFDKRVNAWRADPMQYAAIFTWLFVNHIPCNDNARAYTELPLKLDGSREPRYYQQEALDAWIRRRRRGVAVLPTGTGKSFLAMMAMASCGRSTLVVVPTIDLMEQWASQLEKAFGVHVGMLGGGSKDIADITVSTYDSAVLFLEFIGNRFGLLIVDECHHLPGPVYQQIARMSLAPYRLGLTATPDDVPENTQVQTSQEAAVTVYDLLGQICYRKEIDELEGVALAPYRTETIPVELDDDEYEEYEKQRSIYLNFLRRNNISLSSPQGWGTFIIACARKPGGREALRAQLRQRSIARNGRAKQRCIWELLMKHRNERIIIFTADNETAYGIGDRFLLPVITHHTKAAERHALLDAFRNGELPCLVTSKVLNEGVDVPAASVGIVVSGSGSTREHVQRLGRILRPSEGKTAVLYELVSAGTSEWSVSERRRQHRAYERFN